jgi:tetratricopeptide (TPR) repeat protein
VKRVSLVLLLAAGTAWGAAPTKKDRADAALQARAFMEQKRFEDAASAWEKSLPSGAPKGELASGLPLAGRCYEALGNYQKAITAYQRALQLDEKNADRLLDLARVYVYTDLNREAIELYKSVLKKTKNRPDVTLALAQLYMKTGQIADALVEAQSYARWEPRDPAGQRLLAELDEARGDLPAAAQRRETLAAQDPSPAVYFDLGRLWARAGQWEMADAAFAKAEDLGMRTGTVYVNRGVVAWLKGDAAQARVFWNKALDRHPGLGTAHFFLALLEKEAGRNDLAREQARKARAGAQSEWLKDLTAILTVEKEK